MPAKGSRMSESHKMRLRKPFWDRVEKTDACWIYKGSRDTKGHGRFKMEDGRTTGAHRIAWALTYGAIPDGLLVCHHCDNPPCVRPDHLFLGTYKDNHDDSMAKGRAVFNSDGLQTPESRAKVRAALMGKAKSPDQAARLRAMASHPNPSLETRAKLSAAGKGRRQSAETRAKIAVKLKGRVVLPETRDKVRRFAQNRKDLGRDEYGRFIHRGNIQ